MPHLRPVRLLVFLAACQLQWPVATLPPLPATSTAQLHTASLLNAQLKGFLEERRLSSVIFFRDTNTNCTLRLLATQLKLPLLQLTSNSSFYLKSHYNSELLVLACLQAQRTHKLLFSIAQSLQHMRQTRIIMLAASVQQQPTQLQQLARVCEMLQLTNMLLLFDDFERQRIYYRLQPYPYARLVRHRFSDIQRGRLQHNNFDLQGRTLITLPDQIYPRSLLYVDRRGRQQLSGYVGKLALLFAAKYNATLRYLHPVAVGQTLHMSTLKAATAAGRLDFAITVYTPSTAAELHTTTYPFEVASWLVMVPCTRPLPIATIYEAIIELHVVLLLILLTGLLSLLYTATRYRFTRNPSTAPRNNKYLDLLLNDKVIRGLLGQAFISQAAPALTIKFIYLLLFLLGLVISTMYSTYLHALLTSPPHSRAINSFADMRAARLPLLLDSKELAQLRAKKGDAFFQLMQDVLVPTNTSVFQRSRQELRTAYGYTVTTSLWPLIEQQQLYYTRKLFCTAPALEISNPFLLSVPIQENSPYKPLFDRLIFRLHETGLLRRWQVQTFYEMVQLRNISLEDKTKADGFRVLQTEDLLVVWYLLVVGVSLAALLFCGELLWTRIMRKRKNGGLKRIRVKNVK